MSGLTATPTADGAGVTLAATALPVGAVSLARLDVNGYSLVRIPATTDTTAGGAWTLVDYEVALTGTARYLLIDAAGATASAVATMPATAAPQLRQTFRPTVLAPFTAVTDLPARQELARTEHQVIGRADTVFTTYALGLRAGAMTIRCATHTAALAVVALYGPGKVVLLRSVDHPGLDMHHIGTAVDVRAQARRSDGSRWWDVAVSYTEVRPAAGASLLAWTCADLLTGYGTAAVVGLAYRTWQNVIDNVVSVD